MYAEGAAAFPTLALTLPAFAEHLAEVLTEPVHQEHLPAEDLFLAAACSREVPRSTEEFEARNARVFETLRGVASRVAVDRDELLQTLRTRLFVPNERGHRLILTYAGRGPLAAWVRVVGTRLALELAQRGTAGSAAQEQWERALVHTPLELAAMRDELRGPFQRALNEAVGRISATDRALLTQYYAHGVGIDGLAKLLGIHRSNASRALARARMALLSETKRALGDDLMMSGSDLSSALRLMRSDLGISLRELFQAER